MCDEKSEKGDNILALRLSPTEILLALCFWMAMIIFFSACSSQLQTCFLETNILSALIVQSRAPSHPHFILKNRTHTIDNYSKRFS